MEEKIKIGLVGTGNLGRALMKRFIRESKYEYIICDEIDKKSIQLAVEMECRAASIIDTVEEADFLFLALPPIIILPFITEQAEKIKKDGTIINLSTSVDTMRIQSVLKRKDIEVVGIKPVCQASAMGEGRQVVFFSSSQSGKMQIIKTLLSKAGEVIQEDEMKVKKINEYATLRALELIIQLKQDLEQFQAEDKVLKSAIGNVAVGTLMDFPYTKENVNGYITNIINKYHLRLY